MVIEVILSIFCPFQGHFGPFQSKKRPHFCPKTPDFAFLKALKAAQKVIFRPLISSQRIPGSCPACLGTCQPSRHSKIDLFGVRKPKNGLVFHFSSQFSCQILGFIRIQKVNILTIFKLPSSPGTLRGHSGSFPGHFGPF